MSEKIMNRLVSFKSSRIFLSRKKLENKLTGSANGIAVETLNKMDNI